MLMYSGPMPSAPADIPFIARQIETCLRLAEECERPAVAAALRKLARAFAGRAVASGAEPDALPAIFRPERIG
jgi:hypothetical protein